MRFLPDGPNLPDELLEERDNGNVVFLCGAGVSRSAGMPDFLGLSKGCGQKARDARRRSIACHAVTVGRRKRPSRRTSVA